MRCLLIEVSRFLKRTGMSATKFGREAMHDPRFVFDLRNGRQCGEEVRARIAGFIAAHEAAGEQCD